MMADGTTASGVVGYVRVSTDQQVDGQSLDHQRTVITDWCARHALPLLAIEDAGGRGESGKDLHRDGLERVDARILAGGVSHVVVTRIDRLTRSLQDMSRLLNRWRELDVQILAIEEGISDPAGGSDFLPMVFAMIAENERLRILSRMRPGLVARFRSGLPQGRVPYGYRLVAVDDPDPVAGRCGRTRMEPHPDQAPVVQEAFRVAAHHDWGPQAVTSWLRQHHPSCTLAASSVDRLLRNPIYAGILTATFLEDGDARPLLCRHAVPLIEEAVFATVQDQATRRRAELRHGQRQSDTGSWLGGIARCHHCGCKITTITLADGSRLYACRSRSDARSCGAAPAPMDIVDVMVLDRLYAALEEMGAALADMVRTSIADIPRHLDHQRGEAAQIIAQVAIALTRLDLSLEDGAVEVAAYDQRRQDLLQRQANAATLLGQVDGLQYLCQLVAVQGGDRAPGSLEPLRRWMPFCAAVAALDLREKRRLVASAARSITLLQDDVPFCDCSWHDSPAAFAGLSTGMSRAWAASGGHQMPDSLPDGISVTWRSSDAEHQSSS